MALWNFWPGERYSAEALPKFHRANFVIGKGNKGYNLGLLGTTRKRCPKDTQFSLTFHEFSGTIVSCGFVGLVAQNSSNSWNFDAHFRSYLYAVIFGLW